MDTIPKKLLTSKIWTPKQVLFTSAAIEEPWGKQIFERISALNLPIKIMKNNRIVGLKGIDERETYRKAKSTLAIVNAPPGSANLQPIPPSADYQFHLAQGCPAHCQYCYLAGSLQGPPVTRTYANLPTILDNLLRYRKSGHIITFEASCYTDPLGIEHLTGSLAETIRFFGKHEGIHLRWVTKFDQVDRLLDLDHNGHTQPRISLNSEFISKRMEGGTASLSERLQAIRKLALPKSDGGGGYEIGIVIAPIMAIPDWKDQYDMLLDSLAQTLNFSCKVSFELISHRFTPGSKVLLQEWYPNTLIDFDETFRSIKLNKYGGKKWVYSGETMKELKNYFYQEIHNRFPSAKILYWT